MATEVQTAVSSSLATPIQPAIDGHVGAVFSDTITVDRNKTLALTGDELVLTGGTSAAKRSRTCGLDSPAAPSRQAIPLYNILWAEQAGQILSIDYAQQVSDTRVRAAKWTFTIRDDGTADIAAWIETLMTRAYGPSKRCKRAKVFVNPRAGPGGAEKKWERDVLPLFKAARMPMDVVHTKYSGEAVVLAEAVDIEAFDTIVACSGDGLPHEIFNGLAKRPDARKALQKIAVSHIPCGSGNAMSCNLNGTYRVSLAALAIIKGVETPFDLVSVTQGDRRLLSFLSQALGVVAEADLATEHLRWMGGARFTWGFLVRMFGKKCYPCDLAVKVEIEGKENIKAHYERVGRDPSSNNPFNHDASRAESMIGDSSSSIAGSEEGLPPLKYGTVNDKLPEGWQMILHEKLGNFYCGNMAYMAADANFFAAACANDGLMDLVCLDGDASIVSQLGLFMSVESGTFFDNPLVKYSKVSAFRIIPRNQEDGYISIDGERVPFEPFQAEIHKGLGKVLSKRGVYEAPGP